MAYSMLFMDGFDHYSISDILKKWTAYTPGTISSSTRFGYGYCFTGDGDSYAQKTLPINAVSLVCGFAFYVNDDDRGLVQFREGTTIHSSLWLNVSYQLEFRRGSTILQASTKSLTVGNWYYVECAAYIHDSVGKYEVRVNNDVYLTGTNADTRNGGSGYVDNVYIPNGFNRWDDFYIKGSTTSETFEFIGDHRIYTLYPTTSGTYSGWSSSTGTYNYALVNEEQVDNDTTYVYTSGTNVADTYKFTSLSGNPTITAVQLNIIARKDDAGTRTLSPLIRYSGTNYTGTVQTMSSDYIDYFQVYTAPPWGGSWTKSILDDSEFGMLSIT